MALSVCPTLDSGMYSSQGCGVDLDSDCVCCDSEQRRT